MSKLSLLSSLKRKSCDGMISQGVSKKPVKTSPKDEPVVLTFFSSNEDIEDPLRCILCIMIVGVRNNQYTPVFEIAKLLVDFMRVIVATVFCSGSSAYDSLEATNIPVEKWIHYLTFSPFFLKGKYSEQYGDRIPLLFGAEGVPENFPNVSSWVLTATGKIYILLFLCLLF